MKAAAIFWNTCCTSREPGETDMWVDVREKRIWTARIVSISTVTEPPVSDALPPMPSGGSPPYNVIFLRARHEDTMLLVSFRPELLIGNRAAGAYKNKPWALRQQDTLHPVPSLCSVPLVYYCLQDHWSSGEHYIYFKFSHINYQPPADTGGRPRPPISNRQRKRTVIAADRYSSRLTG